MSDAKAGSSQKKPSYGALLQATVGEADRAAQGEKKAPKPGTADSITARVSALQELADKSRS